LLGKPIPESDIKYISKSEFKKKCLSWDEFVKKAQEPGVRIFDTRDSIQKGLLSDAQTAAMESSQKEELQVFMEKNNTLLDQLDRKKVLAQTFDMMKRFVLNNRRYKHSTFLVFDQVGKQVRWLMYQLEQAGIAEYYFLDKGAYGVIGVQAYGN
jgi:hypothetical protein